MSTNAGIEKIKELREAGLLKASQIGTPLDAVNRDPKSLRKAINCKCWQCEGEYDDPNVQWRIGNCTITDCGLYMVRPYQDKQGAETPASLK